jgi:hypothetical protein
LKVNSERSIPPPPSKSVGRRGTAGVIFVPGEAKFGPGVRLVAGRPHVINPPTVMTEWDGLPFVVEWKGQAITVFVTREAMDDLGGFRKRQADDVYVKLYEKHRGGILDDVARAAQSDHRPARHRFALAPSRLLGHPRWRQLDDGPSTTFTVSLEGIAETEAAGPHKFARPSLSRASAKGITIPTGRLCCASATNNTAQKTNNPQCPSPTWRASASRPPRTRL